MKKTLNYLLFATSANSSAQLPDGRATPADFTLTNINGTTKKVITKAIETLDPENFGQAICFIRIVGKTDVPYAQKNQF